MNERGNGQMEEDVATLVQRAQQDPEAFGVLYDRYVDRIFRYLLGRTGNVQVAEDLTAETFLAALKSLWRFRWTGKPFSAWLYRIALAKIGDYYRQQRRWHPVALEMVAEFPDPRPRLGLTEDYAVLQAALQALTPPQREAMVLFYFEDCSLGEIAWIMRRPKNTIKSHLRRGLERLRQRITPDRYGSTQPPQPRGALAPRGAAPRS